MSSDAPAAPKKCVYAVPLSFAVIFLTGFLLHREHRAALSSARRLTRAHLQAVGDVDVDVAMQHYGSELFAAPKRNRDTRRAGLAKLHGLRLCEEYLGVAALSHGSRGLGWYAHVSYRTAYSNQPVQIGFKEVFDVFCPLTGTNCVIIDHWYD